MKSLKRLFPLLAYFFPKPIREIHLHALPDLGSTLYIDGVFGRVLVSSRGASYLGDTIPHRLIVSFEGELAPFLLFAEGIPVDLQISSIPPSWEQGGSR